MSQHVPGHAAKYEFRDSGVTVRPHDQEIGGIFSADLHQYLTDEAVALRHRAGLGGYSVSCQVLAQILPTGADGSRIQIGLCDVQHVDALCRFKQRNRISNCLLYTSDAADE